MIQKLIAMKWGICSHCNKWAEAPPEFNESKHFLKCGNCSALMYLDNLDPQTAGYRLENKTTATTTKAPKH